MKKALITGVNGQLGSHLADFLLAKGYEVHGSVRPGADRTLVPLGVRIHDALGSERFRFLLEKIGPDEIYNLAAASSVAQSWESPIASGDSAGLDVTRLLTAVRLYCPRARVYQASSSEMFGKYAESPASELTSINPQSPYACAKAYGHFIAGSFRQRGLYVVSGICFNAEGPRRRPTFVTRKISLAVAAIVKGITYFESPKQTELVLGDLTARRDWGYAGDYVEAMWLTMQLDEPEDFVIATGAQHSVAEFCDVAFSFVGLDWQKYVRTDPEFKRPAEISLLVGDPRKIEAFTGWKAKTGFVELVRMMIDHDLRG